MVRYLFALAWLLSAGYCRSDELTATEMKWLRAGWPVLEYAEKQQLPIDIVVQPEASVDDLPIAMGFGEGRCQLVISMRGNPNAEATLKDVSTEDAGLVIEAMVAHEVAHCWRYMHGVWHTLPAGFTDSFRATGNDSEIRRQMRDTRREEAFADLVGLAWIRRAHPEHYSQIYSWFEQIRKDQPVAGGHHDTRVWIQMARDSNVFAKVDSPFEQANEVWMAGLQKDEAGQ
jgi:hypothetical protein